MAAGIWASQGLGFTRRVRRRALLLEQQDDPVRSQRRRHQVAGSRARYEDGPIRLRVAEHILGEVSAHDRSSHAHWVRDDGGSWDLGYPNSWLIDGKTVGTLYYFNSKDDPIQANGGVRHVERSIFTTD
jgi:hypothetical protein